MSATIECPACKKVLIEHRDKTQPPKNTYTVIDIYHGENTGSVDDDFTRTIQCNHCGFTGNTEQWLY